VPALATFTLEVNEWNGAVEPRLVLRHAQPAVLEAAAAQPAVLEDATELAVLEAGTQPAVVEPAAAAQPAVLEADADSAAAPEELVLF
jgi:single-stranded-DNA-specific exonuclease